MTQIIMNLAVGKETYRVIGIIDAVGVVLYQVY